MKSFYKILIVLLLITACLFIVFMQVNSPPTNTPTKKIQNSSQMLIPILVSGPVKITKPGLYQLTNDLTPLILDSSTGTTKQYMCILIRSSDVIFDGMGHVIDGKNIKTKCEWSASANSNLCEWTYGIYSGSSMDQQYKYSNVVIRNVTISNWKTGLQLSAAKDNFLESSVLTDNECGIRSFFSSNITINRNRIQNNKGCGIEGRDNEKFTISKNLIANNQNTGIFLDGEPRNKPVTISIPDSLQIISSYPIFLGHFATVEKQMTSTLGHTIYDNEIRGNKAGISLKNYNDNIIEQNRISDHQGYGLWLDTVYNTTIKNNIFINSSDKGYKNWEKVGTSISLQNCGRNVILINNTVTSDEVNTYNYPKTIPFELIIGPLLVVLLKILAGISKTIINRFSAKFRTAEQKVTTVLQSSRISELFDSAAIVSIISAIILGGVFTYSTQFGLKADVFLILSLIGGIVIITPKVVQYFVAQRMGMQAEYRMWWGGILIMIFTTLLFKFVFGQPVRTEVVHENTLEKKKLITVMLAGPVVSILLSSLFLLLYLMKGTYVSLAMMGLEMSLLTALVTFLPISPMEGERVFKWNKIVWAALFFPVFFGYGYFLMTI